MMRYYDPKTGTESINETGTPIENMPEASRKWFEPDSTPDGMEWVNDPTGRFPVLQEVPLPTNDELKIIERQWAQSELNATDSAVLPDSPYTNEQKTLIKTYRAALRNPARELTENYPAETWRPVFPVGIKRPGA